MGKKYDLSAAKMRQIEQCLGQGMKTLDNSRKLKHDHRIVKRFVADLEHIRACADKGRMRKVSAIQICRIMRAAATMPLQSSKQVFEAAGASGVPQTSRCRILQKLAVVHKPTRLDSRLALNRGSRLDFTPRPTLFFLPACFFCLVSYLLKRLLLHGSPN